MALRIAHALCNWPANGSFGLPSSFLLLLRPRRFSISSTYRCKLFSCLGLCDLRRLYDIYYAIHLCRLNRLVLRLPACISSSTEDESSQYIQSISFSGDGPHARQSGAGDPLSEEAATRYAEVLDDEISLVAEFREVILEVVVSRHGEDGTLWCCPCCCRRCYIGRG